MDLRIFTEPQQGASFADLLAVARATRDGGFSAFFRSDHLLAMGGDGRPGPSESWVSLAAVAALVDGIRLGTLVTSATFRHPSMLALAVATADDVSGGRVELGLGTGWFEAEHTAYGVAFGASFGERFDRYAEQLEIITGLWDTPVGETFDHTGRYWTLAGAPALPKPVQTGRTGTPRVPLVVGGRGTKRTPALAARYADDFNVPFAGLAETTDLFARVREACAQAGRDASEITYSAATTVVCGRDDADVARRADAVGRSLGSLVEGGMAGTPAQLVDTLGRWAEAGTDRVYLQVLDLADLDQIELIAAEVLPQVR